MEVKCVWVSVRVYIYCLSVLQLLWAWTFACVKIAEVVNHPHNGKAMEELYLETLERDAYVSSLGYRLVFMWECQWKCKVRPSRDIKAFLAVLLHCVYHV